jgi:hypothetical protein
VVFWVMTPCNDVVGYQYFSAPIFTVSWPSRQWYGVLIVSPRIKLRWYTMSMQQNMTLTYLFWGMKSTLPGPAKALSPIW